MKYSVEERKRFARELRKEGRNCCQCVAMAFDDVTGLDKELVARMTEGFGSGFGGRQDVCGTLSGSTMICGMAYDLPRKDVYGKVKAVMSEFEGLEGSCICRELKVPGRKPCLELITDAVEILHKQLEADGK